MNHLSKNLFGDEHEAQETLGDVVFFKIFELFIAAAAAELAWGWGRYIRRISDVVLPLGIAKYVDVSFLFAHDLSIVNAVLITILIAAGFFRLSRYAYLGAFLLLHLQYAARYCLGEISHSSNLIGLTLLGLGLALLAFSDAKAQRQFTLGFTYFFVGLGYTLAGVCKLFGTGLFWPDGRHLWLWIYEKGIDAFAKTGVLGFNGLQQLALGDHLIATALLTIGLLTELCAFLMWWKRFRTPVILAVIGLHFGIYFSMNIMFTLSLYELILLGLPWAAWIDKMAPPDRLVAWGHRLERLRRRYA